MKTLLSNCFALSLVLILLSPWAAWAEDEAVLTLADQPVRILRATSVYKGTTGVLLQKNDLVETAAGPAQIEFAQGLILALAPNTRIYWLAPNTAAGVSQINVLDGWVKILHKGSARIIVMSPQVQLAIEGGASILHSAADKTEIFAESGVQFIAPVAEAGRAGEEKPFPVEHYALWQPEQGIKTLPRPPKQFISDMPMNYRDPLNRAPDRTKGAKIPAVMEREVMYADVKDWLVSNFALGKTWVKRFKPRLKDKEFRAALDLELGQTPDWKPILHPPPPPPPKPKITKPYN